MENREYLNGEKRKVGVDNQQARSREEGIQREEIHVVGGERNRAAAEAPHSHAVEAGTSPEEEDTVALNARSHVHAHVRVLVQGVPTALCPDHARARARACPYHHPSSSSSSSSSLAAKNETGDTVNRVVNHPPNSISNT